MAHFGDTSFRRANVVEAYREVLLVLSANRGDQIWSGNNPLRAEIYKQLVRKVSSLSKTSADSLSLEKQAQRARTYTSALVKIGLCDDERRPTDLGLALAAGDLDSDHFEETARLRPENAAILRGLLTYSIGNSDSKLFPFRLLLRVMQEFDGSLSLDQFRWTLLVAPTLEQFSLDELRASLTALELGTSLEELLESKAASTSIPGVKTFIETGQETPDLFPHGKGQTFRVRYWAFVNAIQVFQQKPSTETALQLLESMSTNTVKDGFWTAGHFPTRAQLRKMGVQGFYEAITFPGFQGGDLQVLRRSLLTNFTLGKQLALIGEYSDNNQRLAAATGLFSMANQRVDIKDLFAREYLLTAPLVEFEKEHGSSTSIPARVSFDTLFGIEHVEATYHHLQREFGLHTEKDVADYLLQQRKRRFYESVTASYPEERVRQLLTEIAAGYPEVSVETQIRKAFPTEPSVPTAYEYLIGLSAYYSIAPEADPLTLFGMALDADFLPLSPAPGGRGDIEIFTENTALLIEVTLMNPANQRRNELEPVLRHASNFHSEFSDSLRVYTVFVANQIDPNVNTVLSFARFMPLTATMGKNRKTVNPDIECRSTRQWLEILSRGPSMDEFLETEFGDRPTTSEELFRKIESSQKLVTATSIEGPDSLR